MDISNFSKDASKVEHGIWIDGLEDSRFLIRSADSKAYRRKIAALARKENGGKLRKDPETQQRVTIRAMAEEILVDWEGINENGTPLQPTIENKIRLLGITEIRELVAAESQDIANFRSEGQAADAADLKSVD